jgi:alkanesulfonate monooxygenase SsuD/methylene tetrahydromethanopterin reductase-like flavin-dependent oxidoreductase (luciferase family)
MTDTWFGLLLGSQRRAGTGYPAVRAEAEAAVAAGIRVLVAPEHLHAEPYTMLRPWPLLAALRSDLGRFDAVGSVIAGLSSVEQLRGDLATVESIGSGTAGVALAAGYRPDDFTSAGRSFADRYRLRAELRRAVTGHPVWSAAANATAAARAVADGAVWYGAPTSANRTAAGITAATGRPGVLRRDVLIGGDDRWNRYVAPKYGAYANWGYTADGAGQVIAGTAAEVTDRLGTLLATVGPAGIVVRLCWPDMDGPTAVDHVSTFCSDVLASLVPATRTPEHRGGMY